MSRTEIKSGSPAKKEWLKPGIIALDIKKDTFGGTGHNKEKVGQTNKKKYPNPSV